MKETYYYGMMNFPITGRKAIIKKGTTAYMSGTMLRLMLMGNGGRNLSFPT